ncbi:MAG: sigma-54-dependent transcriptional regulator [Blastocatellales bacterium]
MSDPIHILVVDDEPSIRQMLEAGLRLNGFGVTCVRTGHEALAAARDRAFDAVISDIFMPDGDGIELARDLRALSPHTPLILMTAHGSVELAVQAVAEGARDFIAKPFAMAELIALVRRILADCSDAESEVDGDPLDKLAQSRLIGRCAAMVKVYKLIAHAARTDATILITGKSGTGKELVARAIHDFSARKDKPFIAVNCAGLTETLLEAELFGYTKGAFTGATSTRGGLFEAANGGTLFLDELASTSDVFQASLLRALQSGEVRRIGSTEVRRVNVRIIGASNAQLMELIAIGKFREDLYYRLSVLAIDLPPLRERNGDAELLAQHFLRRLSETGTGDPRRNFRLTAEALEALRRYSFPGNVRELENALLRATVLSTGGLITPDCLPRQIAAAVAEQNESADSSEAGGNLITDWPTLEELDRRYIKLVFEKVQGNRRQAARMLGMNRRTIQRLVARYELEAVSEAEDDSDETDADSNGASEITGEEA